MFVISIAALKRNTAILREVKEAADCKLVLALKGFSCWKAFPFINDDLDGCCASGLWEAQLARDFFGKHVVTYSPAYDEADIAALCDFTHHLDFNSLSQWFRFRETIMAHPRFKSGELQCGLRVNPQCSTGHTPIYDPCVAGSRLGITADQLEGADLTGLSGLHFHTLCEQDSDDLEKTLAAVDEKFGHLLRSPQFTYLNMGGGHWITKPFYDRERLVRVVRKAKADYGVEVWLEPGEAVAIHTGVLRATVMDVFESGPNLYRLGGPTCLAGDVVGDFSFPRELKVGDTLVFDDMAHYTMVKTTRFNGGRHPPIALQHDDGRLEVSRDCGDADVRDRLA